MATANRAQRIAALRKAGWPESLIAVAVAISLTEFGPQRDLITQSQSDYVSNGVREDSWGPWQIHLPSHPEVTKSCAMDLDCSTAAALRIYNRRNNFTAWSVFNSGAYLQNLQSGDGSVIGTNPTVPVGPPPGYTGVWHGKSYVNGQLVTGDGGGSSSPPSPSTDTFPSFKFPHFDIIKPAHVKWPGGGIDFAGVGFNTGIVFKLGATLFVFILIFVGLYKLTSPVTESKAPSNLKDNSPGEVAKRQAYWKERKAVAR